MAVLEIIDSLDSVADADKTKYTEVDGKFQREVEIPDVSTLESTLKKERDARKDLEKKIDLFSGVDPEKYKTLLEKEESNLSEAQKSENALKKLNDKIESMDAAHKADIEDRDAKLQKFHLDEKSRKAAIAGGVEPDYLEDAMIVSSSLRKLDKDGNIVIVDAEGDPTGKTLEEFFSKDFKESKPLYYKGIAGGGGATTPGQIKNNADLQKMSPIERLNAARAQKQA